VALITKRTLSLPKSRGGLRAQCRFSVQRFLAGVLLAAIADSRVWSPALAEETPAHIEKAPRGWLARLYPDAWGTDYKILINPRIIIAKISFGRGTYQLTDGTDAYEYLEKRCSED
jgi:hypothetical protein